MRLLHKPVGETGSLVQLPVMALMAVCLGMLLASCGTGPAGAGEELFQDRDLPALRADAYLYDLRVYRDGKPTSIRLELFRADSLLGLNGRAYLGKGALKGVMTPDSLILFFPTRNEYLAETVDNAAGASGCGAAISEIRIARFLSALPDSLDLPVDVQTVQTEADSNNPEFEILHKECGWKILLRYDLRDDAHSLKRFEYDDGAGLRITADRREFKPGALIPGEKFQVRIPAGAARISP